MKDTISLIAGIGATILLFFGMDPAKDLSEVWVLLLCISLFFGVIVYFITNSIFTVIANSAFTQKVKNNVENVRENHEMKMKLEKDLQSYQEAKNSFQYFSNDRLMILYSEYKESRKEDLGLLAIEEELVKRGIMSHSPMHEKLYALNKQILKS